MGYVSASDNTRRKPAIIHRGLVNRKSPAISIDRVFYTGRFFNASSLKKRVIAPMEAMEASMEVVKACMEAASAGVHQRFSRACTAASSAVFMAMGRSLRACFDRKLPAAGLRKHTMSSVHPHEH